ncbi:MAG TPA: hypothetical protein PL157_02545 [Acidobacteriota bacterium]|nr:hypothetical protein [Acidobacteriota bacterium]
MKSLEQISDFITDRIAAIYERPLPFGGTPDSVEAETIKEEISL